MATQPTIGHEETERIAKIWSGILGQEVHMWQVPLLILGMDLATTSLNPTDAGCVDAMEFGVNHFRNIVGDDVSVSTGIDLRDMPAGSRHLVSVQQFPDPNGCRTCLHLAHMDGLCSASIITGSGAMQCPCRVTTVLEAGEIRP